MGPVLRHPSKCPAMIEEFLQNVPFAAKKNRRYEAATYSVPELEAPAAAEQSTQVAFGRILHDLARRDDDFAARLVTTSPDVTVSTNLGGFVNMRGIFHHQTHADFFKERKLASPQKWDMHPGGQHIELGIAENNLFLMLAALGLSDSLWGERLLPIGTLYDPFIARGLDALNYACYQGARFMLVATPSGLTLAPEGGAHQSITSPLIGMGQPGLTYLEPAFADELAVMMGWGFEHMQAENGGAVYLRLSTRPLAQPERTLTENQKHDILQGAYWLKEPDEGAELVIAYTGALAPEAISAHESLLEDCPGAGLLAVTSPDLLHSNWRAGLMSPWTQGRPAQSHIDRLLAPLARDAVLVTAIDGAPATLSWIGSVRGQKCVPLGVETFGQVGDIPDLYAAYRLDAQAIVDAAASAYLPRIRRVV